MEFPQTGDTFQGRYEIAETLGEGGFARVYRARDLAVGRDVALKLLVPRGHDYDGRQVARFLREAKVVAELQDPHTITVYDYGERDDGLVWMACEYVAGEDLREVLRREGRFPPDIVAHILAQLLSSLREAHARGIIHRDIKPANILVHRYGDDRYAVKLLDFGLAKPLDPGATRISQDGELAGTPRYMSPEQILGGDVGPRTDIYSLGLVAFEMLAGSPAVQGITIDDLFRQQVAGADIRVEPHLAPATLRAIIEKMSARQFMNRYGNVEAIQRELREVQRQLTRRGRGEQKRASGRGGPAATAVAAQNTTVRELPRGTPPSSGTRRTDADDRRSGFTSRHVALAIVTCGVVAGVGLLLLNRAAERPAELPPSTHDVRHRAIAFVNQPENEQADVGNVLDMTAASGKCAGMPALDPGVQEVSRFVGITRETALVRIPRGYDPATQWPVIWLFHDVQQSGAELLSHLDSEHGDVLDSFVVVAPEADKSMVWSTAPEFEEAREQLEMVRTLTCVDPQRIYAWGHGFGGRAVMWDDAACILDVAAVATTAYRVRTENGRSTPNKLCQREPVPYLHVGVSRDVVDPSRGGGGCFAHLLRDQALSIVAHERLFEQRHGCRGTEETTRAGAGECRRLDCDVPFTTCRVRGSRAFPGIVSRSRSCVSGEPADFPYADVVVSFFAGQHYDD